MKFRKEKWTTKYEDQRVVMWDDTNLSFRHKPSTALNQRISYSSYYAENCAKGGVFLQMCGWMGVEDLWTGAISDTLYQTKTGIFQKQCDFVKHDRVNDKEIPFTNIVDKGYRITLAARRAGKQLVLQPVFANSDRKFTGKETILSASVASDRSGNKRAVNRAKDSHYLQRGLEPNMNPARLNNVLLAWSFQENFMYKPVL